MHVGVIKNIPRNKHNNTQHIPKLNTYIYKDIAIIYGGVNITEYYYVK